MADQRALDALAARVGSDAAGPEPGDATVGLHRRDPDELAVPLREELGVAARLGEDWLELPPRVREVRWDVEPVDECLDPRAGLVWPGAPDHEAAALAVDHRGCNGADVSGMDGDPAVKRRACREGL